MRVQVFEATVYLKSEFSSVLFCKKTSARPPANVTRWNAAAHREAAAAKQVDDAVVVRHGVAVNTVWIALRAAVSAVRGLLPRALPRR
jgi:hypothetical protein